MTVSAHDARHVYHGATRNGFASTGESPPANLYVELYPHMRSVQARAESMEEVMHGYMMRRGPRSLKQLCTKAGRDKLTVRKRLEKRADMFKKVGRLWDAIPQEKPPLIDKRQAMGHTLAALIDAYLLEHGPSTVREITDGIGHPDIRYVSAIIAKPPCKARRINQFRKGAQVWSM
jgi:hypothetical protein